MTHPALDMAEQCKYPDGFWPWYSENRHIWDAFKVKALRMALLGRKRYSARTIIETIRWDTEIRDSEVHFKINNNYVPGLARLFMHTYGDRCPGFFDIRDGM